jgi:hypothetical protein
MLTPVATRLPLGASFAATCTRAVADSVLGFGKIKFKLRAFASRSRPDTFM